MKKNSLHVRERNYRVLIADSGLYSSPGGIPELLHKAGAEVEVYCPKYSWLLKNSYWGKCREADTGSPAAYAAGLIQLVRTEHYDWVILCDDESVCVMNDAVTDSELFRKILPLSKIEHRSILGSKAGLSLASSRYNITTPSYAVCEDVQKLPDIPPEFSFPVFLKLDKSGGGHGVFLCDDMSALQRTWESLPQSDRHHAVVQRYIRGDNVAVEALYREGVLLGYASATVLRNLNGEFGISVERRYQEHPGLERELIRTGEALGLHGFVNMTYIYEPLEKKYYLVEADMRSHMWFALCARVGTDFSQAARNFLTGSREMVRPEKAMRHPVVIRHFVRDMEYVFEKKDLKTFLKWCVGADERWHDVPCSDPVLFWALLRHMARRIWGKVVHSRTLTGVAIYNAAMFFSGIRI